MASYRKLTQAAGMIMLVLACVLSAHAQSTTGNVRGTVTDQNGAVVPNAKVTLNQKATNTATTVQTGDQGDFAFNNLLVGDYTVTIEAPSFKALTVNEVRVQVSQTTDVPAQLTIGALGETVEVTAGGAELVETTTGNLSKSFSARQVVELAQTSLGGAGVNNLSLIAPGVTSSGGVGVGTGGSVGGQRPRNNNFVLDGVDNNDKSVTGPQSYISPEEVAEFSLLQNQFSSEFGRSNGGQFLTVTKSGSNDFHGTFYGFFRNRYLNAIDNSLKLSTTPTVRERNVPGTLFLPRTDYFRGGVNNSGRVIIPWFGDNGGKLIDLKDKLFYFWSYERLQTGAAAGAQGAGSPTAAGFALLNTAPGLSARNLAVFRQFLPTAAAQDTNCDTNDDGVFRDPCFTVVSGRQIPYGTVSFPSPSFFKQNHAVINLDYNQSQATQFRFRFTMTNGANIDTSANLPAFFTPLPSKQRLFSATLLHNFSANVINETRIAFRRSSSAFPVPSITFPGLDSFPNIQLDDLGVNIGPDPNAPQFGIENNYQIVNNVTWLRGNHAFKFGGDFRDIISPQSFSQRVRGDYEYGSLDQFLRDLSPDQFGQRNAGNNIYYGNQKLFYGFVQDDWRVRPNLTLNMGVNYSYQEVPLGARTSQALNSISSVPGLIDFHAPTTQKKNFAPKVGFAYSPNFDGGMLGRLFGASGKSSIRGGFSVGYDYVFDNLYILSNPPQLQQTNDVDPSASTPNFLANGGLPGTPVAITSAAVARANTASFIPDQKIPYSLTYTGSIQRQFKKDWSVEVRYLGTRGVHLLTQNRLNVLPKVDRDLGLLGLPTFLSAPSQATIDSLGLTLATINARPRIDPRYAAAGFINGTNLATATGPYIVGFLSNGNSTYHGGSAQLTRRFSKGFQMTNAYTYSHLIDDTTAEVFSTVLSPRRVEDFRNLKRERADSALDHRHRFVSSAIYEVPFFNKSESALLRTALGGFSLAATYTVESGEKITVRSGNDANLNGDSAGDRAILNPGGTEGVGSLVTPLLRSCPAPCSLTAAQRTVGYMATNGNAKYIQTGNGAESNIARNTFSTPAINNFDISVFKNFRMGESRAFQVRADFFNAFNHPQYVPGSVNTVDPISVTSTTQTQFNAITPVTGNFLKPDQVFSSNPRVIQMSARFTF